MYGLLALRLVLCPTWFRVEVSKALRLRGFGDARASE